MRKAEKQLRSCEQVNAPSMAFETDRILIEASQASLAPARCPCLSPVSGSLCGRSQRHCSCKSISFSEFATRNSLLCFAFANFHSPCVSKHLLWQDARRIIRSKAPSRYYADMQKLQGEFGEGELECMNNGCCAVYFKWTRTPEPGRPPGAASVAAGAGLPIQRFFLQACSRPLSLHVVRASLTLVANCMRLSPRHLTSYIHVLNVFNFQGSWVFREVASEAER